MNKNDICKLNLIYENINSIRFYATYYLETEEELQKIKQKRFFSNGESNETPVILIQGGHPFGGWGTIKDEADEGIENEGLYKAIIEFTKPWNEIFVDHEECLTLETIYDHVEEQYPDFDEFYDSFKTLGQIYKTIPDFLEIEGIIPLFGFYVKNIKPQEVTNIKILV